MRYEIRYYQDHSGCYILHATCDTLEQARDLRAVSGDLVVDALTNTVVDDPLWLWDWERTADASYARANLGRRRPGTLVGPYIELFGRYGIL